MEAIMRYCHRAVVASDENGSLWRVLVVKMVTLSKTRWGAGWTGSFEQDSCADTARQDNRLTSNGEIDLSEDVIWPKIKSYDKFIITQSIFSGGNFEYSSNSTYWRRTIHVRFVGCLRNRTVFWRHFSKTCWNLSSILPFNSSWNEPQMVQLRHAQPEILQYGLLDQCQFALATNKSGIESCRLSEFDMNLWFCKIIVQPSRSAASNLVRRSLLVPFE